MIDEMKTLCCPSCGLMLKSEDKGNSVKCPRCYALVIKEGHRLSYDLALSIAALILYFPAMFLPILSYKLGLTTQTGNMFFALKYFYEDGYELLSVIVFFTTILAPFIYIIVSFLMFSALYEKRKTKYMKFYFSILFYLREWVMLDIYIISILVSIVKLQATADVMFGSGLIFLVGLSLCSFLLSNAFSPRQIWRAYHAFDRP